MPLSQLADLLWGRVTRTAATVILAIVSTVGGTHRPWPWIIGAAAFLVVHSVVSATRDRSIVRRLGRDYDRVLTRVLQVVSDLGEIAADRYGLWIVDLYVPESRWSLKRAWPPLQRHRELSRQLSISLADARAQPPFIDPTVGPHGEAYSKSRPVLWIDEGVKPNLHPLS